MDCQWEIDLDRPLWDGEDCSAEDTCCSFNHPPWFSTVLPNATSDDIEVRLCGSSNVTSYSTPISLLELYCSNSRTLEMDYAFIVVYKLLLRHTQYHLASVKIWQVELLTHAHKVIYVASQCVKL